MIPVRRSGALIGAPLLLPALLLLGAGCVAPPRSPLVVLSPVHREQGQQDPQRPGKRWQAHRIEGTPPDWDPLSAPLRQFKEALAEWDVALELDASLVNQWASHTDRGKSDLVTFSYELDGDWAVFRAGELGDGHLLWSILGSEGLNYSTGRQTTGGNVGSVSLPNTTLQPDPVIVNELFWEQVFEGGRTILALGKIDMSSHFDTNRVANHGFTAFLAGSLENNRSIPFPAFGGFGGILRARISKQAYLMVGMADSSINTPVAPWETLDNDSWYQLFELGITLDFESLGKGEYRLTPWHNDLFDQDGWGIALSIDQELGSDWLVGFLRAGTGDEDVVSVETFLSGGLGVEGLFDRPHDLLGLGVTWSEPSPSVGSRSETLLEAFYRIQISPSLQLSPDVQVVFNPTNGTEDTVLLLNVRLNLLF